MLRDVLSILIGLYLGYFAGTNLFKKKIKYHGPNSNIIRGQIYKNTSNNGCYKMEPVVHICPISFQKSISNKY